MYGMECIYLKKSEIDHCKSVQGSIIKKITGFVKRSHHSYLLQALHIPPFNELLCKNTISLCKRLVTINCYARDLHSRILASYLLTGKRTKGTLVDRVVATGHSPVSILFNGPSDYKFSHNSLDNGVVDSLRYLIHHENFLKPWRSDYILAGFLTRAF